MSSKLNPLNLITFLIKNDLVLPLILLASYFLFLFLVRGVIPTSDELVSTFAGLYAKYGYEIIFISALMESLVLINFLVPGQLAMALGIVFARTGQTDLTTVLSTASFGAVLGYNIDYFLGYFGFSDLIRKTNYGFVLDQAKQKVEKFGKKGLILGFVHTNVGAFISIAAGILKFNWLSFLTIALLATFFWSVIWGLIIYSIGDIFLTIFKRYSFLLLVAFIAWLMLSRMWNKKVNN